MNRQNREILKYRILRLASLKSTGSPGDLAFRFGISKRSVKRIVSEIRYGGYDIRYSQADGSYIMKHEFD